MIYYCILGGVLLFFMMDYAITAITAGIRSVLTEEYVLNQLSHAVARGIKQTREDAAEKLETLEAKLNS